jgi:hypothetical protein
MAINIQSLFADIIDTPEQREQKLLQQGMAQGQLLSSGLTGLTRAAAPLAQVAGQLGVQRQENLRRAVQPMIGIDPRTTGEKLQESLANIDTTTPQGLLEAARAVESIDPIRASALRQAAVELRQKNEDRDRTIRIQELQLAEAEQSGKDREAQVAARQANALRYKAAGMPDADIEAYITGAITPLEMAQLNEKYTSAKASKLKIAAISPFTGATEGIVDQYMAEDEDVQNLLREKIEGTGYFGTDWFGEDKYTEQMIKDEAAVIRAYHNNEMLYDEAIDIAVQTLPKGGFRSLVPINDSQFRQINSRLGYAPEEGSMGEVNLGRTNAGTETETPTVGSGINIEERAASAFETLQRRLNNSSASESSANLNATDPSMPMSNAAYLSGAFDKLGNMFSGGQPQEKVSSSMPMSNSAYMSGSFDRIGNMFSGGQPREKVSFGDAVRNTFSDLPLQPVAPSQVSALDQIVTTARRISPTEVPEDASPTDKRDAATFNNYIEAVEKLDFPVLPQLAKKLKSVPAIASAMVKTFEGITRTLNSSERMKEAVDASFENVLDTTAGIVGALVEAQSNTREDGENVLQLVESAEANIREMNAQLGKVPPAIRKDINSASNALLDLVIEYKKRYNLPTPR